MHITSVETSSEAASGLGRYKRAREEEDNGEPGSLSPCLFFFFKILFIYLTAHTRRGEQQRKREKQAPR